MHNSEHYQNIDYGDFDDPLNENYLECKLSESFDASIHGKLLKGIYEYGFMKMSPIQAKTFRPICDGRNLIAQSHSGSGKTCAFLLGSFLKINVQINQPQAIIIANTRELATQIYEISKEIGKHTSITISLCIGGVIVDSTIHKSQMIICTPGRLIGLIKSDQRILDKLKIMVLDEADQLLSQDFVEQIKQILQNMPNASQICLFSATSNSKNVQDVKTNILYNPVEIYLRNEDIKVNKIKNYIVDAEYDRNKYAIVVDLYKHINICQTVIFVNSISFSEFLAKKLMRDGHSVGLMHGKLTMSERLETLKKFRKTELRILVSTDIMSRGIDIQQVGLVINYDIPNGSGYEITYIHRTGRTSRNSKVGVAINIITNNGDEWDRIESIANLYKINFEQLPDLSQINYYLCGSTSQDGYNLH